MYAVPITKKENMIALVTYRILDKTASHVLKKRMVKDVDMNVLAQILKCINEIEKVCCADYEEKESGCIACLEGYTSDKGQPCRPCSKNLYGDKCRYACYCFGYEICDHIKGCVESSPTTVASFDTTSHDMSLKSITRAATDYEDGLLSREIIVYSALSVLVSGFGICLCFVFLKYRTLTKKFIVTISQTQNSLLPQQIQPGETADRLYDSINDDDILDNRRLQQMQISSNYLDTQNQDNNLNSNSLSLKSGDSTSSSDEYQWDSTQDYLNPYQPMIDISPPVEHKYLTIATTQSRVDGHYKDSEIVRNKHELQHPREVEKDIIAKCYGNYSSVGFGSNETKSVSNRKGVKESKSYENLNVEQLKMTFNSGKEEKKDQIEQDNMS
ncbi:Hypothetical predicted protein [Mytilus galloprovincialis]|uniref:Uncharacterized protein n=1 Tax=Mytilus galloprovincialis TaxID=29158 RepID=A0A8B6E9N7_MYTGA|nr:Hypothetical predicted protein [Mytilus galloprovincialis]